MNEKGFWENAAIVRFNEDLLDALVWSWDAPDAHAIDGHLDEKALASKVDGARRLLAREYGERPLWGFKDPRVSVLLPFWKRVLGGLGVEDSCLLMLRNPLEVAGSLAKRDHFSHAKSLTLWLNYTLSSYWNSLGGPLRILTYDSVLADPLAQARALCEWLGLPSERARVAAAFVTPDLKRQRAAELAVPETALAERALAAYRELAEGRADPAVLRRLTDEHLAHQRTLDPMLLEHIRLVKSEEVKFRRRFEQAYYSVWWKVSYPMRWAERVLRRGRD